MGSLRDLIVPVPVNADNYAYLVLTDSAKKTCAAVDPAEADKVIDAATRRGWTIDAVITTHHHHDHSGGNEDLVRLLGGNTPVYGGDDRIPALTHKVEDRAAFKLGTLDVTPLFTVCHTRGSVSFNVKTATESAVFTGDTLFIAGCGRFFEGTPQEMHTSLNEILGKLDNNTLVYCGHEYTQSNLRFAASIEPTNQDIKNKLEWAQNNPVTVPSSIGEEKKINPFMRVAEPSVQQVVGATDFVEVIGKLRELKNGFRG